QETAAHVANDLAKYAAQLAGRATDRYLPFDLVPFPAATTTDILDIVAACGRLLAAVVERAGPAARAWHWGMADAAGFAAMGVGAIVLTGAGRGFCPGADMDGLAAAAGNQGSVGGQADGGGGGRRDERNMLFPTTIGKPLIAAINGACAGLGLVQALMCDLRFA